MTPQLAAVSLPTEPRRRGRAAQDMLDHLNMHGDYVSTSSCSGRVAVFWESSALGGDAGTGMEQLAEPWPAPGGDEGGSTGDGAGTRVTSAKRSKGGQWLLCKHAAVDVEEVRPGPLAPPPRPLPPVLPGHVSSLIPY